MNILFMNLCVITSRLIMDVSAARNNMTPEVEIKVKAYKCARCMHIWNRVVRESSQRHVQIANHLTGIDPSVMLSASHRTLWNEDIHKGTRTRRRPLTVYFLQTYDRSEAIHFFMNLFFA